MVIAHRVFAKQPIGIGVVGTGYAAKQRIKAFEADSRTQVVAVAGHSLEATQVFAQTQSLKASDSWQSLVEQADVDLVVVCHVNGQHGQAVRAALLAGKSVVVEYPLSLAVSEAVELIELAQQRRSLLHVEHIELLGGLHQAVKAHLPQIGIPSYVRYCTAVPQNPAPKKWTYDAALFGFPFAGALSRFHRLTNLFGAVHAVSCQLQYTPKQQDGEARSYTNCRCTAQLQFCSGVIAEVLYAKGDQTWRPQRWMEIQGDRGALVFDGDEGRMLSAEGSQPITVGTRRGLFAKDTAFVLNALFEGTPLYVTPQESLYALKVAAAAQQAAATGTTVVLA